MKIDLRSFFAGALQSGAQEVQKRNKEIQNSAMKEFERLQREATEQNEKVQTQRDQLKATASVLASYRGTNNQGFTQGQIIGLLQNPAIAKRVVSELDKNSDSLDQIDFAKLFEVSKGKTDMSVDDYIKQRTTLPKEPAAPEAPEGAAIEQTERGAFGLPSPARRQAQQAFERSAGVSVAQMRAQAKGLPEEAPIETRVDFSQFRQPETTERISSRLRDNIAKGQDLDTPENKKLLDQLSASVMIKKMFEDEEEKPRTTAQIRQVFQDSLSVGVNPFVIKGVVRYDERTQDFVPITGNADDIKQFMEHKNGVIQNQARAMGILDKNNKVIGGRNSEDALLPYANIKDGKVVSWKTGSQEAAKPAQPAKPGQAGKMDAAAIEREKSMAYAAIAAAGGNQQAVANIRRMYKQKTGQDLP